MTNIQPAPRSRTVFQPRPLEQMPETGDFQTVAEIFKQLADGNRIRISGCSAIAKNVINLSAMVGMSSPGCEPPSQAAFKGAQLITSRREEKKCITTPPTTIPRSFCILMIEQMIDIACPNEQH